MSSNTEDFKPHLKSIAKESSSAPIEPHAFSYGLNVVDIGDLRVTRGRARRVISSCKHMKLTFDKQERRIWCQDCESDVEAFDAFMSLSENMHAAIQRLRHRAKEVKEAEAFAVRSRATKALDLLWRGKTWVPVCPHCSTGLLPEQFAQNPMKMNASLARRAYEAKREKANKK